MERKGIPAVAIVSEGFERDFSASAKAFALADLESVTVPQVYNNLAAPAAREQTRPVVPALIRQLTGWETGDDGGHEPVVQDPPVLEFESGDGLSGFEAFNAHVLARDWADGYPVWPAVPERVEAVLDEVGADPDEVVCLLPPGNGEVTLRKVAIACTMAGCRASELAVVEAALRALSDEWQSVMIRGALMSTSAHAPLFVVNGPVVDRLGINGGRSCVGPGAQNAVNLRIGRAVVLCLKNLGFWRPGIMDLDTIGTTRKNVMVVAENEAESPWSSFHVEQGFDADDDVVTLFFSNGEWDVGFQGHVDAGQLARAIGSYHGGGNGHGYLVNLLGEAGTRSPNGRLLLMGPGHAQPLHEGGMDKDDVRHVLFEMGREPAWRLIEPARKLYEDGKVSAQWRWLFELDEEAQHRTMLPLVEEPADYSVVVCGSSRAKSLLMPTPCPPISVPVRSEWLGTDVPA